MATLFTGVTGLVGSHLGSQLINRGEVLIFLARNNPVESAEIRTQNVLQHVDSSIRPAHYSVITGDITQDNCGISEANTEELKQRRIKLLIHTAASVKFDDSEEQEIWDTNFKGTQNVLSLARLIGVKRFYYISTIYASSQPRNPYEASKSEAEKLVAESGLPYSIIRLPIIVGDSESGDLKHPHYNGFYGYFKGIHQIAERQRKKRGYNGIVDLPIYVDYGNSTLNIAPIDWVAWMIKMLVDLLPTNQIFNIAHNKPPMVQWVMKEGFKAINVAGIQYHCYGTLACCVVGQDRFLKTVQKAVDKELKRYLPYVTEEESFDSLTTQKELGERYAFPPPITSDFMKKLLDSAVQQNFGKGIL